MENAKQTNSRLWTGFRKYKDMLIVLATYDVGKLFGVSDLCGRVFSRMCSVCLGLPERCLLLGGMPLSNG